ncbi:MAG: hypothetical protein EAZ97_07510 [Bacteroidetes bacterium]|nr:MAG: hypothetical protein EAZ97_07510 [Bacteroidota bacterium]
MKKLLFLLLFVFISESIFSQTAPKYSNEFLAIGVGARGQAMGSSQVAVCEDVTGTYWNPAAVLHIKNKFQAAAMHASYFAGIANYDYLGIASSLDSNTSIGASLIRFGIDNIPDTRQLVAPDGSINYDKVGSFSEASYAFMFTFAKRLPVLPIFKAKGLGDLLVGANVKVINRKAGIFGGAWGFGVDVGAQLSFKKWRFGVMGKDITSTINFWNYNTETFASVFLATGNKIKENSIEITLPRLIIDVARDFVWSKDLGFLLTAGLDFTFDGKRNTLIKTNLLSADLHAGMEINYQKKAFLRAGVGNFQEVKELGGTVYTKIQPNFGLGFVISDFTIDYALTNFGQNAGALYSQT